MPSACDRDAEPARRAAVRLAVASHDPVDAREIASTARILAELDTLEDPFDEHAGPVHLTASALIVGRRGLIMHRHRRLGRWMQPGGHLDPGEDPRDAAIRESQEETGIGAAHPPAGPLLVHLDVHPAARGHVHLDLRYLLLGADMDPAPPPGESQDVRWCSWEEAAAMADEALSGGISVAQACWEANEGAWRAAAPGAPAAPQAPPTTAGAGTTSLTGAPEVRNRA
jgi:8-oxo-dGTP pyrophosphatase MutT (NUDIX family)